MSEIGPELPSLGPIPEGSGLDSNMDMPQAAPPELDVATNGPELAPAPTNATEVFHEVLESNYLALQERMMLDPVTTEQELELGIFMEEIQPQVRDAVLIMHEKGYDIGNALYAGFTGEQHDHQTMALLTPLSVKERTILGERGFFLGEDSIGFHPENQTDLGSIKATWDSLAHNLPGRGNPAGPAMFGNAIAFRDSAERGTLLDYYMPNGELDMVGTKYVRERDLWAGSELFLSDDVMSATRELTFIDQYQQLKDRLISDPAPSTEELNMGAYKEELEPQVREAVLAMRRKGYNTGSSGFWGPDHADQSMDIATPLDNKTRTLLAKYDIQTTDHSIHFKPVNPSNLETITETWNMVASALPDLGKHAEMAYNSRADVFRYATKHGKYNDYLEGWLWQTGALNGRMDPLRITMVYEGRNFGPDVHAAAGEAEKLYLQMETQAAREKVDEAYGDQ